MSPRTLPHQVFQLHLVHAIQMESNRKVWYKKDEHSEYIVKIDVLLIAAAQV